MTRRGGAAAIAGRGGAGSEARFDSGVSGEGFEADDEGSGIELFGVDGFTRGLLLRAVVAGGARRGDLLGVDVLRRAVVTGSGTVTGSVTIGAGDGSGCAGCGSLRASLTSSGRRAPVAETRVPLRVEATSGARGAEALSDADAESGKGSKLPSKRIR